MLTDNGIIVRRTRYGCCALTYLDEMVKARAFGDTKCYEKNMRLWLYLHWAKAIMDDTPVDGETGKCGDRVFAQSVASKADCFCSPYGCATTSDTSTPYPPVDPCAIDIAGTVIAGVPVSDRASIEAGPPDVGDSYLIVLGPSDGTWSPNTIQTWNGSSWDSAGVVTGEIIATEDAPPNYWITPTGSTTPGLLFPPVTITWDGTGGTYQLQSDYPQVSLVSGRLARVEILTDSGWVTALIIPEATLVDPTPFSIGGFGLQGVRVTYVDGNCSNTSVDGTIDPPVGCGTLVADAVATAICGDDTFVVTLTITSAVGFLLGDVVYSVDGALQVPIPAVVGDTVLGPFSFTSTVDLTVTNDRDVECNVFIGTYTDPSYPIADTEVFAAVDAQAEPGSPGVRYLIVSDNAGAGNSWAANVGNIWTGSTFVVPADEEIIRVTSVPGPYGYWQRSGSSTIRVFGIATFEYNSALDTWYAIPAPLAPYVADVEITVEYQCSGIPGTIYSGPASGFNAPIIFTPPCSSDQVTGVVEYSIGGCVYGIDVIVTATDLPGEPDPDFDPGNLNSTVLETRIDSQGRIVVCGSFTLFGSTPARRLTRLNPDGSLDTAFNANVSPSASGGFDNRVDRIEVLPDGRIYAAGYFKNLNGVPTSNLVRLNEDGTVDTSFVTGIGFNGNFITDIVLRPDGTLIVIGNFTNWNGNTSNGIISLNDDGSVDTSFVVGAGFNTGGGGAFAFYASRLCLDNNGDLLVSSSIATTYQGNNIRSGADTGLFRILANGTFDTVVGLTTQFNSDITDIQVQDDDDIVVVGDFTDYSGNAVGHIVRISDTGVFDAAFTANNGTGANGLLSDVAILPNGQMIVGFFSAATEWNALPSYLLVRLNSNGTRDFTFNYSGLGGFNATTTDTAIDTANGTLIVVGNFTQVDALPRIRVARLT